MSMHHRPQRAAAPILFTLSLAERGSTALVDHLDILRRAVRETRRDRPFEILAWVVLPDHMHAIWRLPSDDPDHAQRWGRIKARFSRDARRAGLCAPCDAANGGPPQRKGQTGIWQPRFQTHHIRNDEDLARHIRDCWMDPVRHGLVAHPTDWIASSIHRDIREGRLDETAPMLRANPSLSNAA